MMPGGGLVTTDACPLGTWSIYVIPHGIIYMSYQCTTEAPWKSQVRPFNPVISATRNNGEELSHDLVRFVYVGQWEYLKKGKQKCHFSVVIFFAGLAQLEQGVLGQWLLNGGF